MGVFSKKPSKSVAKDRLKLVLIHDRANCSSEVLEMIKMEIVHIISKYMDIDERSMDVSITTTRSERGNQQVPMLTANIPIRNMRGSNSTGSKFN